VNTSLTSGTVMQSSHTALATWFWAAYLVTTQTPGQSAVQFQRQLGISRYETAFQILHKLRSAMIRPDHDTIGGEHPVEVDECMIGCRVRGHTIVGAVEARIRPDASKRTVKHRRKYDVGAPFRQLLYAGRVRLRMVEGRDEQSLLSFIKENVTQRSAIRTDGFKSYRQLPHLGYKHHPLILGNNAGLADDHLPIIHLVFSNLKTWILGTHHGAIQSQHLQAYLNEFTFRFNRRFYPMTSFNSVLGLAVKTVPPTYQQLYSGSWVHPSAGRR
jgi:transposase-like protein